MLNDEQALGWPVVHIHRDFDGLDATTVLSDFEDGAYQATKYLLGLGHKRIACITRPYANIPSRKTRVNGYKKAIIAGGLKYDDSLIYLHDEDTEIDEAMVHILDRPNPPTAIFTMYSLITREVLEYCNDHFIPPIPDELSIIAFDDLPMANLFKTPLTVIDQSSYNLGGIESAKLLLKKIDAPKEKFEDVILPCHLVERKSCQNLVTNN